LLIINTSGLSYRGILLFCLSLFWLNTLFSRTYYISNSGNDTADGLSKVKAWQNISRVNSQSFSAGDSILFAAGGTFTGNIYMDAQDMGSAQKPIFISSYGTGRATIDGGNGNGFFAYNTSGIELKNLIFKGSGYTVNSGIGVYFYMDIPGNIRLTHLVLDNLEIYGFKTSGIQMMSWPTDQSRSGYRDIRVNRCIAHDNGLSGISLGGYYSTKDTLYSHRNVHIKRCIVYNNHGVLNMNSHSGNGIIMGQVDSCIIEYCEAYENGKNNNYPGGGPAGIWAWDSRHVIIQYSYAHHNRSQTGDGDGFDLDGGVQNSIMQYNYAHDNDGPGFLIAQYAGARKMKNNVVRYNISERDGKGLGALIWSGDPAGAVTAEKIDFYNNTIYIDTAWNAFANAALAVYNNYGAMKDIRVCNNILMTKNNVNMLDLNKTINLKFYNNVYYDHGNGYHFRDNGTDYSSLNNWRNATGQEIYNGKPSGFRSNPNLLNAGNGGPIAGVDSLGSLDAYRLSVKSGIIGNGLVIDTLLEFSSITRDYYGDTVMPYKRYTPGAHEILAPKAQFTFSNHCFGAVSVWKNTSVNATACFWTFGDGTNSSDMAPVHRYAVPGTYAVTLIVTGKFGYIDSITKTIDIYKLPTAKFDVSNNCLGDSTALSNLSMDAVSYGWQFGDSSLTASAFEPVHLYAGAGLYKIRLIALSDKTCADSSESTIEVFAGPEALFTVDNHCLGDSSHFINKSSYADSFHWNFGDGTVSSAAHPTRLCQFPGKYTISLNVSDHKGCTDSMCRTMEIYALPKLAFTAQNHCLGNQLPLYGVLLSDSNNTWSFGDGQSSGDTYPLYQYDKSGLFRISLSATNAYGCTDSVVHFTEVFPLPSARFSVIKEGAGYRFRPSDSSLTTYQWQVNGKQVSNSRELSYNFIKGSSYTVSLLTANAEGCRDSSSQTIPDSLTSVKEISQDFLSVYPNPFHTDFTINIPSSQHISWAVVTDVQGKCMHRIEIPGGTHHAVIRMSDYPLAKGIYFLQLNINGHLYNRKLVRE
jgi:PKD repeat protein